jgi:surface protein
MFGGASAFNKSLSSFNTANVTNMSGMFQSASSFNQAINTFDTFKVTNMEALFEGASSFNQSLSSWNTINVTNMNNMFASASAFTQNLSGWCVGTIIAEPSLFRFNAGAFTSPIWGTCPAYSPASSITRIGSATGVDSATLPTHQTGDLIVAFVYRKGSTSLATQPSGWTSLATRSSASVSGYGAGSFRFSYKIAQSASETTGTWTNGTAAIFVVYRGAYTTDLTSTYVSTNTGSFTLSQIVYPDNLYWSSLAWTIAFVGSNSTTLAIETPPTGASTLVANYLDANNESASFDSNSPSASFAGATVPVGGNSLFLTAVLRLRVPITL